MQDRGLKNWLPTYVQETLLRRRMRATRGRQLTHVLFLVCDHYEPRHKATAPGQPAARVQAWHAGYRGLQEECERKFGLKPLHSFFYPPHHGLEHLPALARMAFDGLGEVELHYHHTHDTEETLRRALKQTLSDFRRAGLLLQAGEPPGARFGFIHGDWALDNSSHPDTGALCGVNNELDLLQELGCWADLTMPSTERCQTRKINSIYYAVDDPKRPKSHDWGVDAQAGVKDRPGLMLIQGPLSLNWHAPRYPKVENSSLTTSNWGRPDRAAAWIDSHIHVRGRPDWLFVKLHTHGAVEKDFSALFGERALDMHRHLAENYNDGRNFRMHYVTARQAYNVIRAAEHGCSGDPSQYLDFELAPQATSFYCLDVPHDLECCTAQRLTISGIDSAGGNAQLRSRVAGVSEVHGDLRALTIDGSRSTLRLSLAQSGGEVRIRWHEQVQPARLTGATFVGQEADGMATFRCASEAEIEYDLARRTIDTRLAAVHE